MPSYSPQDLLDHLHILDIPALFASNLDMDERKKSTKITKQKLRLLKKQVKEEIDVIKSKWDGRNSYQARQERLELAPYKLLETLLSQVEVALNELEIRGTVDWRPVFGNIIDGDVKSGEWYIFTPIQATVWRVQQVQKQIVGLNELVARDENTIRSLKIEIKAKMSQNRTRAIIYFIISITAFIVGGLLLNLAWEAGLALFPAGFILVVYSIVLFGNSRKPDSDLETRILSTRQHLEKCRDALQQSEKLLIDLKTMHNQLSHQALP